MDKQQIRNAIQERINAGNDVIISIPESAGFMGDMEAICFYDSVKERMMEATNPLRATSVAPGNKGLKAFVYGETYKMKKNPEYLEKFIQMAIDFGEVQDILGMKY